jgi:hypothetical protein
MTVITCSAVELRPGKKRERLRKISFGASQFDVLSFELFQLRTFVGRRPGRWPASRPA